MSQLKKPKNVALVSERESYTTGTLNILLTNIVVLVVGILARPLLARLLGPEQYGLFALIFSTSTVISAYILLSLNAGVLFFSSKWADRPDKIERLVTTSSILVLALAVLAFLPLFAIIHAVSGLSWDGYLASFALGLSLSVFTLLQGFQQGMQHFKSFSLTNMLSSVLAAGASLVAAYFASSALEVSWVRAGSFFILVAIGFLLWRRFGRFDMAMARELFRYALPLGLAGCFSSLIVVVDRYFLARLYPSAELGYYDIAYSLVTAVLPFTTSLLVVMAPKVIQEEAKLKAYHGQLLNIKTIILTTAGIGLFYLSDILVSLLLGKAYAPAAGMIKIIAIALPLMGIYSLYSSLLPSIGKTRVAGLINILLVLASVLFNYFLVPAFGGNGASAANILAYLVAFAVGTHYLRGRRGLHLGSHSKKQLALYLFFIGGYFLLEGAGFLAKIVGLTLFAALTFLLQRRVIIDVAKEMTKAVPGLRWIQQYLH